MALSRRPVPRGEHLAYMTENRMRYQIPTSGDQLLAPEQLLALTVDNDGQLHPLHASRDAELQK